MSDAIGGEMSVCSPPPSCVAQAGLEFVVLLLLFPEYLWDCRDVLLV